MVKIENQTYGDTLLAFLSYFCNEKIKNLLHNACKLYMYVNILTKNGLKTMHHENMSV